MSGVNIDLNGRTAIVTGSGQGIGWAIAKGLAEAGAAVTVVDRREAAVASAIERIRNAVPGASAGGVVADLSTAAGIDAVGSAVPRTDILVNALGIYGPMQFPEIDDAEWQRYFDVNVMSGIRLCRRYLPGMLESDWGRVVFVSSESALQIPPEMIHYGMTKICQLALSRGLAEYCAGTGVTVNSVLPGFTLSEGVVEFLYEMGADRSRPAREIGDEFVRTNRPTSIIQRAGLPEEVANMVVFLCSPLASVTTGAAVSVDGGTRRSIA